MTAHSPCVPTSVSRSRPWPTQAVSCFFWLEWGNSIAQRSPRFPLAAIDLVVLRGGDLPLPIALQPGISPDLALLRVGMRFVFANSVLAAVNDCHAFAERPHLGVVERASLCRVRTFFIA